MLINIEEANLMSVWRESFKGKDGDDVEFFRALVSVPGESPMQLSVQRDDFQALSERMGSVGTAVIDLDAKPGNRIRVYLKDVC